MAEKTKNSNAEAARTLLEKNRRIFEGDRTLWIIFTVLLVVSILVVYSSTAKMAYDITSKMTTTDSLRQQIMFVVLAIPTIFIVHKIDYKVFMRLTPLLYYIFIALTVATYFVGTTTNGAARWIAIGPIQFQPSEGLKILTILMLARRMESRQGNINKINLLPTSWRLSDPKQQRIIRENTIPLLGPIILSCLVIVPAHTSTAVLIFLVSIVMLYIGRVRLKELVKFTVILGTVGVLGLGAMSMVGVGRGDTAGGRLSTWANEWLGDDKVNASYELSDTQRAMIAIRNGGLFGEGAGHSTSRAVVIHPESDYAYAFFLSEYGLIIGLILMLLYLWVFFRSMEICKKCKTAFPALMTMGLGLLITCQALLHIFVQVNIIPETGQTLPLISRGGTSLLFTTLAFGMIISVSRTNQLREENERNKTR
ncbi:MAG: FtsW/RodA/SpoVE family cell cycle protein [Alistipes sp.]|jgi:cell division protein FtsW|nr:FtsW/RodA/SpoVE family cell cycle protein [Alistipes sp.]